MSMSSFFSSWSRQRMEDSRNVMVKAKKSKWSEKLDDSPSRYEQFIWKDHSNRLIFLKNHLLHMSKWELSWNNSKTGWHIYSEYPITHMRFTMLGSIECRMQNKQLFVFLPQKESAHRIHQVEPLDHFIPRNLLVSLLLDAPQSSIKHTCNQSSSQKINETSVPSWKIKHI